MSTTEQEATMPPTTLALTVPSEMSQLVSGSDRFELAAQEFVVDSEPAFQVADEMQTSLKAEAKKINDLRMDFTRPLDKLKEAWMSFFRPAVEGRTKAAAIYQQKMSAYMRAEREKAEAARREAEELLRKECERLEAEARKREADALKMKSATAKAKALADAEQARQAAAIVPETVALSAPEPQTVASNIATIWKAEVQNPVEFLQWVITRPEWISCVTFKDAEMNRLARQMRDAVKVPGVKFSPEESFRTKSGRR